MHMYKELYYMLFNCITDAIDDLESLNFGTAKARLIAAQQETEEHYLVFTESDSFTYDDIEDNIEDRTDNSSPE